MKRAYVNGNTITSFDNGLDGIQFPITFPNTQKSIDYLKKEGYHFNYASVTIAGQPEEISSNPSIAIQESSDADA